MSLREYRRKRSFAETPEPSGAKAEKQSTSLPQFVVQKHAATRLHYDFRLEHDGVLKSWAVPHGPSLDPSNKSLAVQVEDHPMDYASFEGTIPKGQYGGGTVMVWDRGTWECEDEDSTAALEHGKLSFRLNGEKLQGAWTLVRMHGRQSENWLLIKKKDEFAVSSKKKDIITEQPLSVLTQRDLSEIADGAAGVPKNSKSSKKQGEASSVVKSTINGRKIDLKKLSETPTTKMPSQLAPQLATLSKTIPRGDEWLHEIKLDGYRILARVDDGQVTLMTRSGLDWTDRFPTIAKSLGKLPVRSAWLDGEIVAEDENGISSFQKLQNALSEKDDSRLVVYLFDLPWAEGHDLSQLTLMERKEILKQLLVQPDGKLAKKPTSTMRSVVRFHDHIQGAGAKVLDRACDLKLEGIVSKRRDSAYEFRRTDSWIKTKCQHEQEFVIAGYTRPAGQRTGLGALLLGYYRDKQLVYCGRVGTGFSETSLQDLSRRLKRISSDDCPYAVRPTSAQLRGVSWVQPKLVAQVSFAARTNDGILRHAVFHGLREDKPAKQISLEREASVDDKTKVDHKNKSKSKKTVAAADRELPDASTRASTRTSTQSAKKSHSKKSQGASIEITHPDRVVYEDPEITKTQLVDYLVDISRWLLPGIVGRPLSLLRCPQGVAEHCFYQKQFDDRLPSGLTSITVQEKEGQTSYPVVKNLDGLLALAQLNTVEFHPWPALAKSIEHPDRLIFDLDPGEGATWSAVLEGAQDVRELLEQVSIQSFVRTSGGKGLHVVAPLEAGSVTWDELKEFAKVLAQTMARQNPKRYVATIAKAARRGKVFVDYLRNQRGATAVASYSPRARSGAGVAMPLRWQDLSSTLTNAKFSIVTAIAFVKKRRVYPWPGFDELKQTLPKFDS